MEVTRALFLVEPHESIESGYVSEMLVTRPPGETPIERPGDEEAATG